MDELKRLIGRLKGVLRRRGCTREDADDLIQDAFERLQTYCKTTELRNKEAVLVTMVRNAHVDAHRREHYHAQVRQLLSTVAFGARPADLEAEVDAQQRLQDVCTFLDQWPVRTREIYLLHHLGYHYGEIAQVTGISASAVEKHMAKAAFLLAQWRAERR